MEAQQIELLKKINAQDSELNLTEDMFEDIIGLASGLDITDTSSLTTFGIDVQRRLAEVAEMMLSTLKSPLSDKVLSELTGLTAILTDDPLRRSEQKQLEHLLSKVRDTSATLQGYQLELLKELAVIDMLIELSERSLHELALYSAAAELLQRSLGRNRNFTAARRTLEARAYELHLTRVVSARQLPLIIKVREDSATLAEKVQSAIYNTIPLWLDQIILSLNGDRSRKLTAQTNSLLLSGLDEMIKLCDDHGKLVSKIDPE